MSSEIHSNDDQAIIEAGYKPQLKRNLGFFSSFAISFSYMSVLTGIFANYGFVLTKAGPFGYWTWPLVSVGHMLVALVFAEMAGRMPLTGCSYNWNSKLTHPISGWFAGWMAMFAYAVGTAAVTATIFPPLQTLLGVTLDPNAIRWIGVGVVLLQGAINIYSVRFAAYTNLLAVTVEIIALIIFGLLIFGVVSMHGHAHTELLVTVPETPRPYLLPFMMSCLLCSWTLLGFEGAADVSEETINVRHVAPKGIIQSTLYCGILGFFFVVALTVAIPDLAAVTAASDPVSAILTSVLGAAMTRIFLILALISIFACSLVNLTGASRVVFAMARDKRFIASNLLQKVSNHKVPSVAIALVTFAAAGFVWFADSSTALYGAAAVLYCLFYLLTVVGFAFGAGRVPASGGFSLGRCHWPVVLLAIMWLIFEIGILTVPEEFHPVAAATGWILVIGVVVYLIAGRMPKSRPLP